MKRVLDFIGIGTPKCGTDWIVECIRNHPEIDLAKHKEPNYYLSKNSGLYSFVYNHMRIKDYKSYMSEFTWEEGKKHGEFSIQYIYDKKALNRIKKHNPDVKVIIALRNPVNFLYSMYWYMKFSNIYHLVPSTFEEAIETTDTEFPFHTKYAYFGKYMSNVLSIFSRKDIHIILLDDIKKNPRKVLKSLFTFLEIDVNYSPTILNENLNKTQQVRFPWLMKIINIIIKLLILFKMDSLINNIMNTSNIFKRVYKKIVHTKKGYPPMKDATRQMLQDIYFEDIKMLEKCIGRDLSHFLGTNKT